MDPLRLWCLIPALAPLAGAGAAPPAAPLEASLPLAAASLPSGVPAATHDLHVSYGNAAVDGTTVVLRVRMFKDDLEAALGRVLGVSVLALAATPEVEAVFLRYLSRNLQLEVGGRALEPLILAQGEDLLDREPVWWYALEYRAPVPITALHVRNTLLFDLFDDQRNVMKFVHFPDEAQQTVAFAPGEESFTVVFGGS